MEIKAKILASSCGHRNSQAGEYPGLSKTALQGVGFISESRARILLTDIARASLRQAFKETRKQWPFEVEAVVLLEDHFHTLWTFPPGDPLYPKRLGYLKRCFTKLYLSREV